MRSEKLDRRHNERILPNIDALFAALGLLPKDLDLVGFTCGPGSFTGIRLAAAVTQAITLAGDAQACALRTNDILYRAAAQRIGMDVAVCAIRSRANLYYLCRYDEGRQTQPLTLCEAMPSWLHDDEQVWVLGEMPGWWSQNVHVLACLTQPPDAEIMISLAQELHAQGLSTVPDLALPLYLEGDSPWRKQGA